MSRRLGGAVTIQLKRDRSWCAASSGGDRAGWRRAEGRLCESVADSRQSGGLERRPRGPATRRGSWVWARGLTASRREACARSWARMDASARAGMVRAVAVFRNSAEFAISHAHSCQALAPPLVPQLRHAQDCKTTRTTPQASKRAGGALARSLAALAAAAGSTGAGRRRVGARRAGRSHAHLDAMCLQTHGRVGRPAGGQAGAARGAGVSERSRRAMPRGRRRRTSLCGLNTPLSMF